MFSQTFSFIIEILTSAKDTKLRKSLLWLVINCFIMAYILYTAHHNNSLSLKAFGHLTLFDTMRIVASLITGWSKKQRSNYQYSYGYARFEVLSIFASLVLTQFGAFFLAKDCFERILMPEDDIDTYKVGTCIILGLISQMVTTYTIDNPGFDHAITASGTSYLQEHFADISHNICNILPPLSRFLLPRVNPFTILGTGSSIVMTAFWYIARPQPHLASVSHHALGVNHDLSLENGLNTTSLVSNNTPDLCFACLLLAIIFTTMFPIAVTVGKILLQTTPSPVTGQLDKCLREAATLEGVLELSGEHFWQLSFGHLVGSVEVRCKRDADEQMVAAHVTDKLSAVVSTLTVQIVKDNWNITPRDLFIRPSINL